MQKRAAVGCWLSVACAWWLCAPASQAAAQTAAKNTAERKMEALPTGAVKLDFAKIALAAQAKPVTAVPATPPSKKPQVSGGAGGAEDSDNPEGSPVIT